MIRTFPTPDDTLKALADYIVDLSKRCIAQTGRFNVALSGGSSPKKLHQLLASQAYKTKIDWAKVYLFVGDERYVPLDHSDSNFKMAKDTLIDPIGIDPSHTFPVNTKLSPDEAAADYERVIKKHFNDDCKFDLILLGLGDNSHTASLFPHTKVLDEKKALVKAEYIEEVKMNRITFTAPLINAAHAVVFLVYGAGKAEAVRHIIKDPTNIEEYPAQLIKPVHGELEWFLDEAAAGRI